MMKFDLPQEQSSIIKVIGVGGGGSNAVNHMYKQGIKGVDFIVCNTDQQALDSSPVPTKIALGKNLTKGRGAGSIPEVGKNAAAENIDEIKEIIGENTEMVFITAGMGGGTGTGAAPVIAQAAREMGVLTVGIVTLPFSQEGQKRRNQANTGIEEMRKHVDSLLIINNDKLREIYGNLKASQSFSKADDVLATAARGIADIITTTLQINTDINDVKTVMKDSGVAIMGSASASGEDRAIKAVEEALASPLLNDSNIKGARYVLLNITCGSDDNEITMDELGDISEFIQDAAGQTAELIKGYGIDESLNDKVNVTIIATGFNSKPDIGIETFHKPEKIVRKLEDEIIPEAIAPSPVQKETTPTIDNKEGENNEPFIITREPAEERSVEFEIISKKIEPVITPEYKEPEMKQQGPEMKTEEPVAEKKEENETPTISQSQKEEQMKKAQERVMKLKELSFKLKTPNGIAELEREPAYVRRNVVLTSAPHSSESQVSRYTLSEGDENNKVEIKPNNSFLHDNVD